MEQNFGQIVIKELLKKVALPFRLVQQNVIQV